MKKYFIIGLACIIALVGLVGWRLAAIQSSEKPKNISEIKREKGIPVRVAKPVKKNMQETNELVGTIFPYKSLEVSAHRGDEVTSSSLTLGKFVRQGEVAMRLFNDSVKAQLAAADAAVSQTGSVLEKLKKGTRTQEVRQLEAALKVAEAQMSNAEKEFVRMANLKKTGSITSQNADKIISARDQVLAGLEAAKQRLSLAREGSQNEDIRAAEAACWQTLANRDLARITLEQTIITAPMDGFIDKIFVEPGEQVANNKPLFNMIDIRHLFLHVEVQQAYINRVNVGNKVLISSENASGTIEGTCMEINPNADPISRTYLVKVLLANPDLTLKPGMFANAVLLLDKQPDALVIPRDSVVTREKSQGVFIIQDQKAVFQKVETGIQDNDEIQIRSGLSDVAFVVTQGQYDLQSGSLVAVQGDVKQ